MVICSDRCTSVLIYQRRFEELQQVVDFTTIENRVWYIVGEQNFSGKHEYERTFAAAQEVVDMIASIRREADCECSYGTKDNALDALRSIGESITAAIELIGRQLRKHFQCDSCLEDAMMAILGRMNMEERQCVAQLEYGEINFVGAVIKLRDESAGYCMMQGLGDVIEMLERALDGRDGNNDTDPGESSSDPALEAGSGQ